MAQRTKEQLRAEEKRKTITYERAEIIINERFKKRFGYYLNWDNPKTFSEKVNFTKLYNPTKLKTMLTDKVTVRDWVKERIGEGYLIPQIGVYDSFDDIDFSKLPKEYVIKCNHDSGSTKIIDKDHPLDKEALREKYDFFFKRNLATMNFEMHYRDIVPKIIVEEKIGDNIKDFKFFCFNGEPKFIKIDRDRFIKHQVSYYSIDGKLLPFYELLYGKDESTDNKMPKKINEMVEICKKLSKGFDFIRVDLYEVNGKVYFGELTFTSNNGMSPFEPKQYELETAKYWKLNTRNRKRLLHKKLMLDR